MSAIIHCLKRLRLTAQRSDPRPSYEIAADLLTDPGCVRPNNEDSILFVRPDDEDLLSRKGVLAIVADGMGGHQAGETASHMAIDIISKRYFADQRRNPAVSLKRAFLEANRSIHRRALEHRHLQGMGTTATALAICRDKIHYAHVGDSRLYRLRGNELLMLSEDHTLVQAMIESGMLTPEAAAGHPDRHIITRAMGTYPKLEIMQPKRPLEAASGDRYLLCSDGLCDLIADEEIRQILIGEPLYRTCHCLVDLAKSRGGQDNISVITVALEGSEPAPYNPPITRNSEGLPAC